MKKKVYQIAANRLVATDTYELVLSGEGPVDGEFVHLEIPPYFLRILSPCATPLKAGSPSCTKR